MNPMWLLPLVLLVVAPHAGAADRQTTPRAAIRATFGPDAPLALRIAWCESRLGTDARNGQHLGLFQMGTRERARFGHGPDALTQARAAHRYWLASSPHWRPWAASKECWR